VGNTPLLPVDLPGDAGRVWLKAEWFNPGGSVKDRAAREILRAGRTGGHLPGRRLLDASSGNTAVAYAMLGAAAGIGVTVCVPANVSAERLALLQAYGAEVINTDALAGSDGAITRARELAARHPERYWYADQYGNPANPLAHARATGPEIWRQTDGRVTHLVAGVGTSGTLMGTGEFLKQVNPAARLVAVQPEGPLHGLEGLKHLATALVPAIYNPAVPDETMFIATERADRIVGELARTRGLFVGWSTGAALVAAEDVMRRAREDGTSPTVVVIAPDSGHRYLSEAPRRLGFKGEA
jgi:cysteine synthase B